MVLLEESECVSCEHVDIIFYVQPNYRVHTRTYVRTYMYVPHLEFLANKGAEIEMSARSRFLGSRLGVLDQDAPLPISQLNEQLSLESKVIKCNLVPGPCCSTP